MTSRTINVDKVLREYTQLRIASEVVDEVKSRIEIEVIPRIASALEERALNDTPPRKTIQEKDCAIFDFIGWWAEQ